ncbi:DUF2635 domain-containing protein [Pseudomonas sp. zfem002]|uniref:DUF2635 domain-containing protein n=1 Tax=Pseudomonas sp. zfem002 TaxID=3078197 RepID=UPI00292A37C8|nr:DUF2635 domain-containing protein [Pseudomonas sp. zfem002]MDU9391542.1 DUF2635 domain-containing protein [Pseudomonas sp. zfem002]
MTTVHLWPAPGRACPMPEKGGELLPAEGAAVPLNAYWQRRINDGDAVRTAPDPAADAPDDPAPKPERRGKA